jgi:aromatic ring-cleaving dioxygenase
MNEVLIGAYYNHYKNKPYKVLDIAKGSEDMVDYVVYQALYENETAKTWIRPYKMFVEEVNGQARFALLDPKDWPTPFEKFHSHIYFTEKTYDKAAAFHTACKSLNIPMQISSLHKNLLGPHPHWMFEVDFKSEFFLDIIGFMFKYRNGLNILVHPLSGNALLDHTDYAMFLGQKEDLNLSIFGS